MARCIFSDSNGQCQQPATKGLFCPEHAWGEKGSTVYRTPPKATGETNGAS